MNPIRQAVATAAARSAGRLSRATGRGSGRAITGKVLLTLAPSSLRLLARGRQLVLVSGTNGKSTTTRLLVEAWSTVGPVTTNDDGANLAAGVAGALLETAHRRAVLEVDEVALPDVLARTCPELVVLLNLARDQLDRVGEVAEHVRSWQAALRRHAVGRLVVNADDPLLVAAVQGAASPVTWVSAGLQWHGDARSCQRCWGTVCFDDGDWWCDGCGLRRPTPQALLVGDVLRLPGEPPVVLDLQLPGPWNLTNAALALVAAQALGVQPNEALPWLRRVTDINGRYAYGSLDGHEVRLLLAKNPASARSVLDLVSQDRAPVVLVLNAHAADGRDPSWLWDVPFDALDGRQVVVTGRRAADLSVRLRYALVEHDIAPDLQSALLMAGPGCCHVIATYTAFAEASARLRSAA